MWMFNEAIAYDAASSLGNPHYILGVAVIYKVKSLSWKLRQSLVPLKA